MDGLSQGVELLKFARGNGYESDWYNIEMAVDNIPCVPFSVPVPTIRDIPSEKYLGEYLERQARTMIERYGDRRLAKMDPALLDEKVA